ncbi:hypothetical protein ABTZ99_13505 [Actinosynnema sp. NPDC002837]
MARSAAEIRKALDREVAHIRGLRDLSDDGKRRRIAAAYVKANDEMGQAKRETKAERETRVDELRRKLFGNPTAGDPASAINFRDALERAEGVKTAQQAARLLQRAHETGDEALGKAVAMRVFEHAPMGGAWGALMTEWAELNGRTEALGDLAELTTSSPMAGLHRSWEHKLAVPSELGSGAHAREWAAEADADGSDDAA